MSNRLDSVQTLRNDPCTPDWCKQLIDTLATKDPVDVANTLDVLTAAYEKRARSTITAQHAAR